MTINGATRRRLCFGARVGAIGSAIMLTVTAWSWFFAAGAATNAGSATVVDPSTNQPLLAGGSSTNFTLKLQAPAECTGDSPNAGYRVQSYMVPSSVDPASLHFDSGGPTPQGTGASFSQPLYDENGSAYVDAQTAQATNPGGPGPIVNIPNFNFKVYQPGDIPAGTYNVGIACTLGNSSSATQIDKYWNGQMTFTTDSADQPAGVTWTAQPSAPVETTTTAPGGSTSGGSTTTTTPGGSTPTPTSDVSTTTTTPGESTTTTTSAGDSTSTTAIVAASGSSNGSSGGSAADPSGASSGSAGSTGGSSSGSGLASTGADLLPALVWVALLLAFGRIAVLLARPVTVRYIEEGR